MKPQQFHNAFEEKYLRVGQVLLKHHCLCILKLILRFEYIVRTMCVYKFMMTYHFKLQCFVYSQMTLL